MRHRCCDGRVAPRALWRKGCASCAVADRLRFCVAEEGLRLVRCGGMVRCGGLVAPCVSWTKGCATCAVEGLQVLVLQREAEPEGCLSIVGCCAGVGAVVVLERSGADAQDCAAAAAELQVLQWGGLSRRGCLPIVVRAWAPPHCWTLWRTGCATGAVVGGLRQGRCGGLAAPRALWWKGCAASAEEEGLRQGRCGGLAAPRALWWKGCAASAEEEGLR